MALAILWRNLKGPRRKDMFAVADALHELEKLPEYRRRSDLAAAAGVSKEMIREFLSLRSLPVGVKRRFELGELTSLEQGKGLYRLAKHRPDMVEPAASAMKDLNAHQSRALVDYLVRQPNADVDDALFVLKADFTRVRKRVHIIAELEEAEYELLRRFSRHRGINEVELVTRIVRDWVSSQGAPDG